MKDYILDSELLSEKTKTAYTILSDMLPILNDIEETSREAFDEINSHDELGYVDYTSIKSNMDYIEEYRDKYKEFGAIGDSGSIYNYKCKDMTGVCYNGFIGEYQSEVDDKFYYAQENTLKKLRDSKLQDIYVENNIGIISPAMAMGSKTATSIYKDKLNIFDLLGYGRVSIAMQKEYEGMKAKIDEYNASLPKYSLEHTSKHLSDYIIEALYGPVAAETMDKLIFDAEIDKQKIHNVDDYINKMVTSADFDFETNDEKILTTAGYFVPVYGEYQILNEIIAGKNPISGVHYSIKDRLDMVAALGVGCAIGKACKGIITEIVSNKAVIAEFTGEAVAKLRIAIKDSTEAIQNVITKVYSRNNGIVEAEFAGVGKGIYIESQVLKDADQICKERYAKWIEGKLAEGAAEAERLISGTPGVVTGGDSTKLGKNIMESMGLKRSTKWTGHQAQHIIPAEMADSPIIQKIGMNLDDATNGILLRTPDADLSAMSRHRGYHSVYNDVVRNELSKLDINQSVDVLQKQVFDLQSNLRKLQESGLPLYPGQGATVNLWERSLNRITK